MCYLGYLPDFYVYLPDMKQGKVRIAAVGLGNRTCKYLHYVAEHQDVAEVVAAVDPDPSRMERVRKAFALPDERCFFSFEDLLSSSLDIDACIIGTPDTSHYEFTVKSLQKGWHVLLEKPMGQTEQECRGIVKKSIETGKMVSVCYVLRYHPYFIKFKQLSEDPKMGRILSIRHVERVGIDRTAHTFARGPWNMKEMNTSVFFTKCCHDLDFVLWLAGSEVKSVETSIGPKIFTEDQAPEGSAPRCLDCSIEQNCPYSAVDLYLRRKDWIKNFVYLAGESQDEMLMRMLKESRYGRCVYRCSDNDVVDYQTVALDFSNGIKAEVKMECITHEKDRMTVVECENAIISGDESAIVVKYRDSLLQQEEYDFRWTRSKSFHAGADLLIVEEFIDSIRFGHLQSRTPAVTSLPSHLACFLAER